MQSLPHHEPTVSAPRWPAWTALLWGWLRPAAAARRTQHVSLGSAYAVHLGAGLLTALAVIVMIAWSEYSPGGRTFFGQVVHTMEEIVGAFERNPEDATAMTALSIAGIELGFVGLSVLLLPWGARDERLRSSFAHALRRTWLWTPQGVPAVIVVGLLFTGLFQADRKSRQAFDSARPSSVLPAYPQPPPPGTPQNSPAYREYQAALQTYQQHWSEYWTEYQRMRPWYSAHVEELAASVGLIAGTWCLWALLRGVGAERKTAPVERPPTCETCGYNLTATPLESRCPECGVAVLDSLGPEARPGALWERRREAGRWRAWWRCSVDTIFRPTAFGRRLRIEPRGSEHRRFTLTWLPAVFAIAALEVATIVDIMDPGPSPSRRTERLVMAGVMAGYVAAIVSVLVPLAGALLVGLVQQFRARRNLLTVAMQMAAYLGGYAAFWMAVCIASFGGMVWLWERAWMVPVQRARLQWLAMAVFFVPNIACLVGYLWLIARGTGAARYANNLPEGYRHDHERVEQTDVVYA